MADRPAAETMPAKSKVAASFAEAVRDIPDGVTIAFGGFADMGYPANLIRALAKQGAKGLICVANRTGGANVPHETPDIGLLVEQGQVRKVICAFTAATRLSQKLRFTKHYEAGLVEAEICPQGTLAERLRAAGAGIPAFYTPTGVGTLVAQGKETKQIDGHEYLMERGIVADFSLVAAWRGDRLGNLVYRKAARNFNPPAATAGRVTIAEVEELVDVGALDPESVHTPGVFVHRILAAPRIKRIERRTVRK